MATQQILETGLEVLDKMREAELILEAEGLVCEDRFKQKKLHPAFIAWRDSKQLFLRSLKALNLDLEPVKEVGRPLKDSEKEKHFAY